MITLSPGFHQKHRAKIRSAVAAQQDFKCARERLMRRKYAIDEAEKASFHPFQPAFMAVSSGRLPVFTKLKADCIIQVWLS